MAGFDGLIEKISRLSGPEMRRRILQRVRDVAHAETVRGFREQSDPYGRAWAPRKDRSGTWPLLQKTGAGIDSLTARISGRCVVLRILGYFRFHQSGTHSMVARMVFPEQSQGLGSWNAPINSACVDVVREMVKP